MKTSEIIGFIFLAAAFVFPMIFSMVAVVIGLPLLMTIQIGITAVGILGAVGAFLVQ